MPVLQLFTIFGFGLIAFQDFKERAVLWLLFPIVGVLLALLHLQYVAIFTFFVFSATNILVVSALLAILWLYTKYIRKQPFLNVSFGSGDVLFLYAFAFGFPTMTFMLLLTSSIFFAILVHCIWGLFKKQETVPLAGLMGLFLAAMLLWSFLTKSTVLYQF